MPKWELGNHDPFKKLSGSCHVDNGFAVSHSLFKYLDGMALSDCTAQADTPLISLTIVRRCACFLSIGELESSRCLHLEVKLGGLLQDY